MLMDLCEQPFFLDRSFSQGCTHFAFYLQCPDCLNTKSVPSWFILKVYMYLSFPQCSWQWCEGGQQDQIYSSSSTLLSAVPTTDRSPLSSVSHPETSLFILLLHLVHATAALPARQLPTPFPAFPVPVPAASLSWFPGFGACGEHVSGLPSEPQDGAPHWGSFHDSRRWVLFLPKLDLKSPTGGSCTAAPGPYFCADGPRWRVAPLSEYGL